MRNILHMDFTTFLYKRLLFFYYWNEWKLIKCRNLIVNPIFWATYRSFYQLFKSVSHVASIISFKVPVQFRESSSAPLFVLWSWKIVKRNMHIFLWSSWLCAFNILIYISDAVVECWFFITEIKLSLVHLIINFPHQIE